MRYFIITISILFSCSLFAQSDQETRDQIQKIATLMQIIDYAYVDTVDMPGIVDETIATVLKELDPHSAYITKEDVEKANEPLEGRFEGIGITFQIFKDTILVIAPVPGGPSDKLGIMAGDKIIKIDGKKATGEKIDNQWVMDHLRGEKGTKVDVSIYRKGKRGLLDYTITRDEIPLHSIDATFMITPEIGYIKLNRFSRSSVDEFNESLASLKDEGMKKLILDLRGNSGGYLGTAVDLADEFLDYGKMIVYTKGLQNPKQEYKATPLGHFEKGELVVMINEGSASASEIVSGAVQDWDRGLVVGRRSFGKGLVQRPFPLPDGSVIRLTTARYYTPTGRSIQRPYEEGVEAYYKEIRDRYENGEMLSVDSIDFPDSLKYFTSNGRTVYGGGGIMPDVYFTWDSTWYSDYYSDIRRSGVMNQFTVDYVDKNRKALEAVYGSPVEFRDHFSFDEIEKPFFQLVEKEGVEFDEEGWEKSGETIRAQLKAMIARNLWTIDAYYMMIYEVDDELQKTVEILEEGKMFSLLNED
jgi:carboxyl-terminal processing protease